MPLCRQIAHQPWVPCHWWLETPCQTLDPAHLPPHCEYNGNKGASLSALLVGCDVGAATGAGVEVSAGRHWWYLGQHGMVLSIVPRFAARC